MCRLTATAVPSCSLTTVGRSSQYTHVHSSDAMNRLLRGEDCERCQLLVSSCSTHPCADFRGKEYHCVCNHSQLAVHPFNTSVSGPQRQSTDSLENGHRQCWLSVHTCHILLQSSNLVALNESTNGTIRCCGSILKSLKGPWMCACQVRSTQVERNKTHFTLINTTGLSPPPPPPFSHTTAQPITARSARLPHPTPPLPPTNQSPLTCPSL